MSKIRLGYFYILRKYTNYHVPICEKEVNWHDLMNSSYPHNEKCGFGRQSHALQEGHFMHKAEHGRRHRDGCLNFDGAGKHNT